tara:strand:+ start:91 stop:354 length:264 start_codon:yes stop_codon:yes gene_type:complete
MTKEQKIKAIEEKQFDLAMEGNVEMLKWVGINLCQQDRKPDMSVDEMLPTGFDVKRIPNEYEKAVVDEYEIYREEFLEWKQDKELTT